jgi:osmoprotectant transport system substrate-binding protein/osmoprotectant transport system permease protein
VRRRHRVLLVAVALCCGAALPDALAAPVKVGSKRFTESYVLGEIARRTLTSAGFEVEHREGMGGTIILWKALETGAIDLYPDYTGTIAQEILGGQAAPTLDDLRRALLPRGIGVTSPLGFSNTYALVVRRELAERVGLQRISDLARVPSLRLALTHEFLERQDGWRRLADRYGLEMSEVRGIEHALAYTALVGGQTDVTDGYSTDARLAAGDLVVLDDDRGFFPRYDAVFLYRTNLARGAVTALSRLAGAIPEALMIRMNAEAERTGDATAAARLFSESQGGQDVGGGRATLPVRLAAWTVRHLELVGVSLLLAVVIGIPLGIRASRPGLTGRLILATTGVIYTIPSLALLALLVPVPFFGISTRTVVVALVLYSLLPIVRNTASALQDIPRAIRESAAALGLPPRARLTRVYLPMASRGILSGVKTSAVINVATATLAALIGAGGLGEPIFIGLSLNDHAMILEGAVPVAVLALLVEALFGGLDRWLIPRGLRL